MTVDLPLGVEIDFADYKKQPLQATKGLYSAVQMRKKAGY